jgi:hypothetical protein
MSDEQLSGKQMEEGSEAAKAQPSGPKGDNPATAGKGEIRVKSSTPENARGEINPAAPGETGTTSKG